MVLPFKQFSKRLKSYAKKEWKRAHLHDLFSFIWSVLSMVKLQWVNRIIMKWFVSTSINIIHLHGVRHFVIFCQNFMILFVTSCMLFPAFLSIVSMLPSANIKAHRHYFLDFPAPCTIPLTFSGHPSTILPTPILCIDLPLGLAAWLFICGVIAIYIHLNQQ